MFAQIENILNVIFAAYVIYMGFLGMILFAGITLADLLTIKPNSRRPSNPYTDDGDLTYKATRFGFFVKIGPGMQIIITRASRFVTIIMDHPGYTFAGRTKAGKLAGHKARSPEYWEVVETPKGESDTHPIPFRWKQLAFFFPLAPISVPWWLCKRIIYSVNGQVFSGIPGFQGPLIYALEWFDEVTSGDGNITLRRVKDFTYFFYVREFSFWIPVGSADTKDLAGVRMFIMLQLWTQNAFRLAFRSGKNWSTRALGTGTSEINNSTRAFSLKSVLGSDETDDHAIGDVPARALTNIREKYKRFGLGVHSMEIAEREASDDDLAKSFQKEAQAGVDAAARLVQLGVDKQVIVQTAEAVKKGGAAAALIAKYERDEAVVKAAGDRAIVSIGGDESSENTLLAALLKEAKDK